MVQNLWLPLNAHHETKNSVTWVVLEISQTTKCGSFGIFFSFFLFLDLNLFWKILQWSASSLAKYSSAGESWVRVLLVYISLSSSVCVCVWKDLVMPCCLQGRTGCWPDLAANYLSSPSAPVPFSLYVWRETAFMKKSIAPFSRQGQAGGNDRHWFEGEEGSKYITSEF